MWTRSLNVASRSLCLLLAVLIVECAPLPPTSSRPSTAPQSQSVPVTDAPSRTLIVALRVEPTTISPRPFRQAGFEIGIVLRVFNAGLAVLDEQEVAHPELSEALPQLNTDSWRVHADGRMTTTYRLKPNLTWHDGTPVSAEDFVFAYRVFSNAELGTAASPPIGHIEEVAATDGRTVTINWRRAYPHAGRLAMSDLPPLPRHLLEEPFQSAAGNLDAFAALPYWTTGYVGVGPYRLDRWEPGASLEAVAFPGYAQGKPKIDRFRFFFSGDPNTVLANLLSGNVHFAGTGAIYYQQASVLQKEWGARKAGNILVAPGGWRYTHIQLRPELAQPRTLLDVRVRRALLHAVDKHALNEVLFEGQGILADTPVSPTVDYFHELDRAITKYPFDLQRTEQLMAEVGYTRAADGVFQSPADGRFSTELMVIAHTQNEVELGVMGAGWRQAGYDVREAVMPTAQAQSGQARAQFPGLFTTGGGRGEALLANLSTAGIPSESNRWTGSNRGAWSHPEYDRLYELFSTTLDRSERNRQVIAMMKIFTDELPAFSLYFQPSITAHMADIRGPDGSGSGWDVHTWEFR